MIPNQTTPTRTSCWLGRMPAPWTPEPVPGAPPDHTTDILAGRPAPPSPAAYLLVRNFGKRLVQVRIERQTDRFDRFAMMLAQHAGHLCGDHLHAFTQTGRLLLGIFRRRILRGIDRPLQIVDDPEDVLEQRQGGVATLLVHLAAGTLAIIVQFCLPAQGPIVGRLQFLLQSLDFGRCQRRVGRGSRVV